MSDPIATDLAWLRRGKYRLNILNQIAKLERAGELPDQATSLVAIGLEPGSSAYGNGRLAILGLLERQLVSNVAERPRSYALSVNWEQVGVFSDWLEEQGQPRLPTEAWKP